MAEPRTPIIDPFRTLRRSFVVICDGHLPSALLLDYFVTLEHALDEARSQGEHFGPWRAIAISYAARVMQYDPNKRTVMSALTKLAGLGFIQAHPQNAVNKGGYAKITRNHYRLCSTNVREALANYYAVQNDTPLPDAVQIDIAVGVNSAPQTSAELPSSAVQNRTQESVVRVISESSSSSTTARMRMMTLQEIEEHYSAFAGRLPTPEQRNALQALAGQYGADALIEALSIALAKGGRTIAYVRRVLENPIAAAPKAESAGPTYKLHVAEEPAEPYLTAEEMREMRRAFLKGGEA